MRVYRASSLGYSLEALVAPHLGFEPVNPPEFMQNAYDEGNRLEPIVLDFMREREWDISSEQEEVNLEVIPGVAMVQGHVDGLGWHPTLLSKKYVIEIKTMAHKSFLDFANNGWNSKSPLITKYKWQASAYMLATGLPHVMIAWDKEKDVEWTVVTTEPFFTIADIAAKLAQAEEFIEKGQVPDGCQDFPCPYYYLHPPKDEVAKVEDGELEFLLREWLVCDRLEKQYKAEKDEKRAKILAMTGDALAAKVKGACGVTVETYWQNESEYTVKKKEGWVTRISGPRGKSGA